MKLLITILICVFMLVGCNAIAEPTVEIRENIVEVYVENTTKIDELQSRIDKLNAELSNVEGEVKLCYDDYYEAKYNNRGLEYSWTGCKGGTRLYLDIDLICNSGSMRPLIDCNHKVYFCKPNIYDINVGDIVLFKRKDTTTDTSILHLVVYKQEINGEYYYTTRGYNNVFADEFLITYKDIIGKLWKIEG